MGQNNSTNISKPSQSEERDERKSPNRHTSDLAKREVLMPTSELRRRRIHILSSSAGDSSNIVEKLQEQLKLMGYSRLVTNDETTETIDEKCFNRGATDIQLVCLSSQFLKSPVCLKKLEVIRDEGLASVFCLVDEKLGMEKAVEFLSPNKVEIIDITLDKFNTKAVVKALDEKQRNTYRNNLELNIEKPVDEKALAVATETVQPANSSSKLSPSSQEDRKASILVKRADSLDDIDAEIVRIVHNLGSGETVEARGEAADSLGWRISANSEVASMCFSLGAVEPLIKLITNEDDRFQAEATETLGLITRHVGDASREAYNLDALMALKNLLSTSDVNKQTLAAAVIGNIANDVLEARTECQELNIPDLLAPLIMSKSKTCVQNAQIAINSINH